MMALFGMLICEISSHVSQIDSFGAVQVLRQTRGLDIQHAYLLSAGQRNPAHPTLRPWQQTGRSKDSESMHWKR